MNQYLRLALLSSIMLSSICSSAQITTFKGKVHDWLTDTVFLATLPFHSPYSTEMRYDLISSDGSFEFSFLECSNPFVFVVGPEEHMIEQQITTLLFDNLTSNHYYGHCMATYTCGFTTYLLEPGQTINADITFQIGKSEIVFHNEEKYGLEYYQTSFNLDDKCDKALEKSKTIESGIRNLNKIENKLLTTLEKRKEKISPFLYAYLKAEIEFGARKEFLKFLRFDHEEYLHTLFSNDIPKEIINITEFDKSSIDYATLLNEEYNEYLENYINYKYSIHKGEYIVYWEFDNEKFAFAQSVLPEISRYFYLANNILHKNEKIDDELILKLIDEYPDGELNGQLLQLINNDLGFKH